MYKIHVSVPEDAEPLHLAVKEGDAVRFDTFAVGSTVEMTLSKGALVAFSSADLHAAFEAGEEPQRQPGDETTG